jgi:DNA-binding IclR family transcriptional regulator
MSAPALAASRAVATLNYFTANPQGTFTLSELSSALSVNMASLSAVLRSLTDAGYLVRHPRHKTYQLGPAVIAAGNAASVQHPVVELAVPEMRRLAKETGSECVGSTVIGDDILIMVLVGRPSVHLPRIGLGQRVPLHPPLGEVFLAWSAPEQVERWMKQLGNGINKPVRDHLQRALEFVRMRGYSINLIGERSLLISETLTELARHPRRTELHQQLADIVATLGDGYELLDAEPVELYREAMVAAPVFGPDGSVVFAITLTGLVNLRGREIIQTAEQLRAVTLQLTRRISGRLPEPV